MRQALGGHQYKACIFIFLSFFTVMFLRSMATNTHAYTHTHAHTRETKTFKQYVLLLPVMFFDIFYSLFIIKTNAIRSIKLIA